MTRSEVTYEWGIETLDMTPGGNPDDPDIIEHWFSETLAKLDAKLLRQALFGGVVDGVGARLVLVRYRGNDVDGELCRSWAYVTTTMHCLPESFHDANQRAIALVPARFRKELKAAVRCSTRTVTIWKTKVSSRAQADAILNDLKEERARALPGSEDWHEADRAVKIAAAQIDMEFGR